MAKIHGNVSKGEIRQDTTDEEERRDKLNVIEQAALLQKEIAEEKKAREQIMAEHGVETRFPADKTYVNPNPAPDGFLMRQAKKIAERLKDPDWKKHTVEDLFHGMEDAITDNVETKRNIIYGNLANASRKGKQY